MNVSEILTLASQGELISTHNFFKSKFTASANKTKKLSMIPQDTIPAKKSIDNGQ